MWYIAHETTSSEVFHIQTTSEVIRVIEETFFWSFTDQMATVIDGKAVAQTIRSEIADEVHFLSQKYGKVSPYFRFIKTEYNKQESWFSIM